MARLVVGWKASVFPETPLARTVSHDHIPCKEGWDSVSLTKQNHLAQLTFNQSGLIPRAWVHCCLKQHWSMLVRMSWAAGGWTHNRQRLRTWPLCMGLTIL